MKKKVLLLVIVLALVFGFTPFVSAKRCFDPHHKGPISFLYLIEKGADWKPVFGGAYGKMHYNIWGEEFNFWFEGHGLVQDQEYKLIYYPDGWPGTGLICLGTGTAHGRHGNVAIWGRVDLGTDLPASYDKNAEPSPPSGAVGAKIWLVLSSDVDCGTTAEPADSQPPTSQMIGWNPSEYLFEFNLITYYHTEVDGSCKKKK
jgi:hypothetical protein